MLLMLTLIIKIQKVQMCLKFANFYHKFIIYYSRIIAFINDLIKSDKKKK